MRSKANLMERKTILPRSVFTARAMVQGGMLRNDQGNQTSLTAASFA